MNKLFQDLKVGDRFIYNGQEFVKTEDIRVSCCRTINAKASNDSNNTTYIQPGTSVVVNA
jgi:hypothetical protein